MGDVKFVFNRSLDSQRFADDVSRAIKSVKKDLNLNKRQMSAYEESAAVVREVILKYMLGLPSVAFQKLKKRINTDSIIQNRIYTVTKGTELHRARSWSQDSDPGKEDLYHISFTRRETVGNERYSTDGHPCLYLGHSTEDCRREIGEHGTMFVSTYRLKEDFRFLDMRIPNEDKIQDICGFLPFIIASSFKGGDYGENDFFRPEYIVPQLITEYANTARRFEGIVYTSVKVSNDDEYFKGEFDNYVFITHGSSKAEYDFKLLNKFEISEPRKYLEHNKIKD